MSASPPPIATDFCFRRISRCAIDPRRNSWRLPQVEKFRGQRDRRVRALTYLLTIAIFRHRAPAQNMAQSDSQWFESP
jgi:hypothetical protein